MERIHQGALDVLEVTGVRVNSERARKLYEKGGCLERVNMNDDMLAIDLINQVGPIAGFYLNQAHTRKWWKREQYLPHAADTLTYPEWIAAGKKPALDYANERAEQLLASLESKLPLGKEEDLDRILEDCREFYKKKGLI